MGESVMNIAVVGHWAGDKNSVLGGMGIAVSSVDAGVRVTTVYTRRKTRTGWRLERCGPLMIPDES